MQKSMMSYERWRSAMVGIIERKLGRDVTKEEIAAVMELPESQRVLLDQLEIIQMWCTREELVGAFEAFVAWRTP